MHATFTIFLYLPHASPSQVLIDEKRKLQQEKREKSQAMKVEGDKFYEAMRAWRRCVAARVLRSARVGARVSDACVQL